MSPLVKYVEWITWIIPPSYIPNLFEFVHFLLFIIYIMIMKFYIKGSLVRNNSDLGMYRFALYSWYLRILSGIFIYYFYFFYYRGGDVINYVQDSINFFTFGTIHFSIFIRYIIHSLFNQSFYDYFFEDPELYFYWLQLRLRISYIFDFSSEMVSLLYLPFISLGLGGYLPSLVIFNAVYTVYLSKFTQNYLQYIGVNLSIYYYFVCNLPSFLVWTSAPFKESFVMLFMIYAAKNLFESSFSFYKFSISVFAIYLAYLVKPYIGVPFLAVFIIAYLAKSKIYFSANIFYKMIYSILFLIFMLTSLYFSVNLSERTGKYSPDKVLSQAYLVYMDLRSNETYYTETGGSVYDLGPLEPTLPSFLSKFPLATFTALFRPFLTEGQKGVVLLASLEATLMLLLFLYLSIRYNFMQNYASEYTRKRCCFIFLYFPYFFSFS
ncbi:MAG: hypothetical protein KatS3mg026_1795 [Bacteroidia bacterium]|nr:MAG: hypothetical protein KatS3mg026_1795 [Bacteroidia bacterium]